MMSLTQMKQPADAPRHQFRWGEGQRLTFPGSQHIYRVLALYLLDATRPPGLRQEQEPLWKAACRYYRLAPPSMSEPLLEMSELDLDLLGAQASVPAGA
jgi:hypothetical protein